jgi:uncharacterized protein YndB with AHSA1/START domain
MRGSVTVHVEAPPDRVWSLVSDVTQIGRFSPETFDAQWLDGATAPAVGVRFRGHVRRNGRGPVYWTTCTIVVCEPDREFAFTVGQGPKADVTESFELADKPAIRLYWMVLGPLRGKTNARYMRATLEAVKADVEAGPRSSEPPR